MPRICSCGRALSAEYWRTEAVACVWCMQIISKHYFDCMPSYHFLSLKRPLGYYLFTKSRKVVWLNVKFIIRLRSKKERPGFGRNFTNSNVFKCLRFFRNMVITNFSYESSHIFLERWVERIDVKFIIIIVKNINLV